MVESMIVEPSLQLLGRLFGSATRRASEAMGNWTNGLVTLSLDEVQELPLEEVVAGLEMGVELQTMVVLGIQGDPGGQLILAFDEENGRRLAASLLGREVGVENEWSELEQSAVMETGNILGSAYLNELTRLTGQKLAPSAPYFIQDYGASVLQQALMVQAMVSDQVLICQTRFVFDKQAVNWSVFFVPSQELIGSMNQALDSE